MAGFFYALFCLAIALVVCRHTWPARLIITPIVFCLKRLWQIGQMALAVLSLLVIRNDL